MSRVKIAFGIVDGHRGDYVNPDTSDAYADVPDPATGNGFSLNLFRGRWRNHLWSDRKLRKEKSLRRTRRFNDTTRKFMNKYFTNA